MFRLLGKKHLVANTVSPHIDKYFGLIGGSAGSGAPWNRPSAVPRNSSRKKCGGKPVARVQSTAIRPACCNSPFGSLPLDQVQQTATNRKRKICDGCDALRKRGVIKRRTGCDSAATHANKDILFYKGWFKLRGKVEKEELSRKNFLGYYTLYNM